MPVRRRQSPAVGSPPFFAMVHNPVEESLVVPYVVPGLFGFEPLVLHYLLSLGKKFLVYIGSFERDVAYGICFCLCASHKKCEEIAFLFERDCPAFSVFSTKIFLKKSIRKNSIKL